MKKITVAGCICNSTISLVSQTCLLNNTSLIAYFFKYTELKLHSSKPKVKLSSSLVKLS